MSSHLRIAAQPRTSIGRNAVKQLKTDGLVPGNIYGAKVPTQALQFNARELASLLDHAASESVLVEVVIAGGEPTTALIQEVQHHPVTRRVLHVDLHAVAMDEVIHAEVPIESTGTSPGVSVAGGVLQQSLRTLEIECLPGDLPDFVLVDIASLNIGDSLHVRDLALPRGVTAKTDAELTVFAVTAPTVAEEEPVGTAAEVATQPEVIAEKKTEARAAAE